MTDDVSHGTSKPQATVGKMGWRGQGENRTGVQTLSPPPPKSPQVSQPMCPGCLGALGGSLVSPEPSAPALHFWGLLGIGPNPQTEVVENWLQPPHLSLTAEASADLRGQL